jgi:hypothetical protein
VQIARLDVPDGELSAADPRGWLLPGDLLEQRQRAAAVVLRAAGVVDQREITPHLPVQDGQVATLRWSSVR